MKRLMFSKMVQSCSLEQAAAHALRLGFDGIDLTCRDGGHVLPENVCEDLPKAAELLKSRGLELPMVSTGITTGEEEHAAAIFETCGRLGIKYVKMGYWWLGDDYAQGAVTRRCEAAARGVANCARLAEEYGTCAIIHAHSGNCVNAIPAFIADFLRGKNGDHIGAYLDFGHMFVEGGNGGWRIGFDILAPYLKVIAVKNFIWLSEKLADRTRWYSRTAPLADGIADWPEIFRLLKNSGFDGYASIHSEYLEDYSWKVLGLDECLAQTEEDLKYLDSIA